MTNKGFEKQLHQLRLKAPTGAYQLKAKQILNRGFIFNNTAQPWLKWSYTFAFMLLLSLSFNVYQYTQPQMIVKAENLVASNSTAQKPVGGYSITQGAMVPYTGNRDIIIILEN